MVFLGLFVHHESVPRVAVRGLEFLVNVNVDVHGPGRRFECSKDGLGDRRRVASVHGQGDVDRVSTMENGSFPECYLRGRRWVLFRLETTDEKKNDDDDQSDEEEFDPQGRPSPERRLLFWDETDTFFHRDVRLLKRLKREVGKKISPNRKRKARESRV